MFYDANFNGIADFLDLNGNRIQDENEPDEPVTLTELDGLFSLAIPEEFDLNQNGIIDVSEGRFVLAGGTDASTGLSWITRMTAASGHFAITPLSTLAENLIRNHGFSLADAEQRVTAAFGLKASASQPSTRSKESKAVTPAQLSPMLAHVELHNTVIQITELLAGGSSSLPEPFLADQVYASLASRIIAADSSLNLALHSVVADVIRGVAGDTGVSISETIVSGAAEVVAAGNAAVHALLDFENPNFVVDESFAQAVVEAKKVMQGEAAAALHAVGAGTANIATVVSDFTGASLQQKIAASTAEIVLPPAIIMSDVAVLEGNAGTHVMEFTVELIGQHGYESSVAYSTLEGTATEANGDFRPTTGVLTWAAGDNSLRTVQVTVTGNTLLETDKYFTILLENNVNAVLRVEQALGVLLNDDAASFVADAAPASGSNTIFLDRDLFSAALYSNDEQILEGVFQEPLNLDLAGVVDINDALMINFFGDTFVADNLSFHGGVGIGVDSATLSGGSFTSIVHQLLGSNAGRTQFQAMNSQIPGVLNWSELESFSISAEIVNSLTIELPPGASGAVLEDADPLDVSQPGMMRLHSTGGQFFDVTFRNPATALVLRGSGITVISTDPAFTGQVTIVEGLAGDYNSDNAVDAADYVVWRKTLGTNGVTPYSSADGSGNGIIDQADYGVWRSHFGQTLPPPGAGSGAAALAITEPSVELGEVVVALPAETFAAPVSAKAATTFRTEFAMFEARATRHNTATPPHERNNVFRAGKSANERLLLALAIDRVRAHTASRRVGVRRPPERRSF